MIGFLRFVGICNAAVWLGATVFFTFWARPACFSDGMGLLLGPKNFPYFSEAIAEILAARLFYLQIFCGIAALLHLVAERLYFSKSARQLWLAPLLAVWTLSLVSGAWLRPKINALHVRQSAINLSAQQREAAAESFNAWQRVAWLANLSVVAGVAVYLWRVANPPDPARFVSAAKFRC